MLEKNELEQLKKGLENKVFDIDELYNEVIIAYNTYEEIIINTYNNFFIAYKNSINSVEYIIEFNYLNDYEILVTCVNEFI